MPQPNTNQPDTAQIIWDSISLEKALSIKMPCNVEASKVSIDSRTLTKGEIFVGIKGENFNGNLFAQDAISRGAALCILDKDTHPITNANNILYVDNALEALNMLGQYKRNNLKAKVIAVTGSAGKTTTKEMLRTAISATNSVYASFGNFNNNYGLALTLANIPSNVDYAVIELGMNHAGELSELSKLTRPDIAIITNVAPAHLEFFKSVSDIAKAKSEIFDGMSEDGIAILNIDNEFYDIMRDAATKKHLKVVSFGESENADFRLSSYKFSDNKADVTLSTPKKSISYSLNVSGKHNALNSCAVLAAINCSSLDIIAASEGLKMFSSPSGRGETFFNAKKQITIFDQSYNANPESTKAAIENLGEYKNHKHRLIAILGDMRELGPTAITLHESLQDCIFEAKIDLAFCVGELMNNLYKKMPTSLQGAYTLTSDEMRDTIIEYIKPGDIILIKGSLSMNMKTIVNALKDCE